MAPAIKIAILNDDWPELSRLLRDSLADSKPKGDELSA